MQYNNSKEWKITSAILTLVLGLTFTVFAVNAATTISTNIETGGTLSVTGASTLTGVVTHGGNVLSDTDSTDDLGSTAIRWANAFVDTYTGDAYRVTNGTTITATGALTKAQLQAASYFLVDTTGSTAIDIDLGGDGESFDAGDIGRTIMFGHGANTGAVTVTANDTLTVATVAAGGAAVDAAGDYIECKILTATLVTCVSVAQ